MTSYNTADFTNLSIADQLSIQKQKRNELTALNTEQKQQQLSHLSKQQSLAVLSAGAIGDIQKRNQ